MCILKNKLYIFNKPASLMHEVLQLLLTVNIHRINGRLLLKISKGGTFHDAYHTLLFVLRIQ